MTVNFCYCLFFKWHLSLRLKNSSRKLYFLSLWDPLLYFVSCLSLDIVRLSRFESAILKNESRWPWITILKCNSSAATKRYFYETGIRNWYFSGINHRWLLSLQVQPSHRTSHLCDNLSTLRIYASFCVLWHSIEGRQLKSNGVWHWGKRMKCPFKSLLRNRPCITAIIHAHTHIRSLPDYAS